MRPYGANQDHTLTVMFRATGPKGRPTGVVAVLPCDPHEGGPQRMRGWVLSREGLAENPVDAAYLGRSRPAEPEERGALTQAILDTGFVLRLVQKITPEMKEVYQCRSHDGS